MKRFYLFSIFILIGIQVSAQVVDLDEEQDANMPDHFDKSTMYYLSPLGTFSYQMGNRNMAGILDNRLDLKPNFFSESTALGIGWRNKLMFYNIHAAFSAFSSNTIQNSRNYKTILNDSHVFAEFLVGRAIVANDRYFLILKGGIGFLESQYQIRQYDHSNFNFDDFATASGVAWPDLKHVSGTFDIALEYMPRALRTLSVMQSVQFGYKRGIGETIWRSSDALLINPVSDRVSILYLRASVVISKQN